MARFNHVKPTDEELKTLDLKQVLMWTATLQVLDSDMFTTQHKDPVKENM